MVLDIETDGLGSRDRPPKLVLGAIWVEVDRRVELFESARRVEMVEVLEQSELVVGFNTERFDLPVLEAELRRPLNVRSCDLLATLKAHLGHRISLDVVARATLGRGRLGTGSRAARAAREQRLGLLGRHCRADVELTRDLFLFGRQHGHVWIESRGARRRVPVAWGAR